LLDLVEFVVSLAVLWRVVFGVVVSLAFSFVVSKFFAGYPSGAWFALAFVGGSVGAVWQLAVMVNRQPVEQRSSHGMSKTFMFLGAAIIGCGWGWLVNNHLGFVFAVGSLLFGPIALGPVFGAISKQPVTLQSVAFITTAFLSGFLVTYGLQQALGGA
jgi:hypothetical protein